MKVNIIIEAIKSIVFLIAVVAIGGISLWLYYESYVVPLLDIKPKVIADPLYFMSIIFGVSVFVIGITTFISLPLFVYVWYRQAQITLTPKSMNFRYVTPNKIKKFFIIVSILGGAFAFVSNIIILEKIIPKNGYIICPKETGYKKNLLRDYVLDVSQCEKN